MVGLSNERVFDADSQVTGPREALFRRPTYWLCEPYLAPEKDDSRVHVLRDGRSTVGKKLYCGNLSYNVNSSDLEQLFAQFGTVESAQVITDRDTGRSKGFGFVEMGNDSEAQAAISGLNETEHDGRSLTVNEAKPRENRGGGGRGGRGGGYGRERRY